jgi:SAM-dependent methyltransferase
MRRSPYECLLCGSHDSSVAAELTYAELARLWSVCGRGGLEALLERELGTEAVALRACQACGFLAFPPGTAGSGAFYEALEDATYYNGDKREFHVAAGVACERGFRKILDVGCGRGAFLDLAKANGSETFGTELNRPAVEAARAKGHAIVEGYLDDVPAAHGKFDFIALFQVIEHVPAPIAVISKARDMLELEGRIFVAVPNERGVPGLANFSPYQWPPHHISRWRRSDLIRLGQACGMEMELYGADGLTGAEIRHYASLDFETRTALGLPVSPARLFAIKALAKAFRGLGGDRLHLKRGHSHWAMFRKTQG